MKQTRGTNGVTDPDSGAQIPRRGSVKGSLGVAGFAASAAVLPACADNNVLNPDDADTDSAPWRSFRDSISVWHGLAERSFLSQQSTIWI